MLNVIITIRIYRKQFQHFSIVIIYSLILVFNTIHRYLYLYIHFISNNHLESFRIQKCEHKHNYTMIYYPFPLNNNNNSIISCK